MSDLPYRTNVGAALFNAEGKIFVGLRANMPMGAPASWAIAARRRR